LGVPGEQVEKPLFLGQKIAKQAQHWAPSNCRKFSAENGGLSQACHSPFSG
jgi:hypothetical protein